MTSDSGGTGLLGILHPFWFHSGGEGIAIEGCDDLRVGFNAPLDGAAHPQSFTDPAPNIERPRFAEGIATTRKLTISGENMTVRFFTCENAKDVLLAFYSLLALPSPPPEHLFRKTMWTTWAHFKNDISHDKVTDFARTAQEKGFAGGILGIDAKWQAEFGSTDFDAEKFTDPAQTIQTLHDLGFETTLWCIPFFHPDTEHFKTATAKNLALKTKAGETFIVDWWEGTAALLNVSDPDSLAWHFGNLKALADKVKVDSFKFDAGEGMFYDYPDIETDNPPNRFNTVYINTAAEHFPWSDVRSGWFNQSAPMLFRQWDKSTLWGFDNGLASTVTGSIAMNLIGYPFSFPDMIGGNQYFGREASAELLIRWTQAVAPMPIIQFSVPPWEFGEQCASICAKYAALRAELSQYSLAASRSGLPIVRPLWWLAPDDETAQVIDDTYLVGDDLLVAPIIEEGARARNIYLPAGRWRSYWNADQQHNAGWLRDYPVPLDHLALFVRVDSDQTTPSG